jgi:hypothetical protein
MQFALGNVCNSSSEQESVIGVLDLEGSSSYRVNRVWNVIRHLQE